MIKSKQLDEILSFLVEELGGDWLLTGGALVCLNFDESRGTEDVDLARIRHLEISPEASLQKLYQWLIQRGLGPEWVNTAVEPFVQEVPDWKNESIVIRQGAKGRVFRPNLTLFTYLKLRRGTEIDLTDVERASEKCPEGFHEKKFHTWPVTEKMKNLLNQLKQKSKSFQKAWRFHET